MQIPYYPTFYYPYSQSPWMRNEFESTHALQYGPNNERFFPFAFPLLLPLSFVAGLAVGPLLFNNRPPYPGYAAYPPPYPPYPGYQAYPGPQQAPGFQGMPQQFGAQSGITENINIFTQ